jgi:hypothetical protein
MKVPSSPNGLVEPPQSNFGFDRSLLNGRLQRSVIPLQYYKSRSVSSAIFINALNVPIFKS